MTDSILIQNGKAHEVWRGIAKADLPSFHRDLVKQIVEAAEGTVNGGDIWDGASFSAPTAPVPPPVLTRAEKFDKVAETQGLTPDELVAEMKARLAR